jgi:hypothetical protein
VRRGCETRAQGRRRYRRHTRHEGGTRREQGAQPCFVGVGNLAWRAARVQNGGAREKRDWADQQAPQVSEQREEGRGKGERK